MTQFLVLDSSVVLKWILRDGEEFTEEAMMLHSLILKGEVKAIVPELMLNEVANVMFWKRGFGKEKIKDFLDILNDGKMMIVPFFEFDLSELLNQMEQCQLSVYDSYYVCLAKKYNCKLVSFDKKLLDIKDIGISLMDLVH